MNPASVRSRPRSSARLVPPGERVVLWLRSSVWSIALRPLPWLVAASVIIGVCAWHEAHRILPISLVGVKVLAMTAVALILAASVARWLTTRYALTDRRLLVRTGVLRTLTVDVPLGSIQSLIVRRSMCERTLGLGTLGISTAAGGFDLVWEMVPDPEGVLDTIRRFQSTDEISPVARRGVQVVPLAQASTMTGESMTTDAANTLKVIGIAGGVGSGKSFVARLFGGLGCLVIDSDELSRRALDRPDVRATLVGWWGDGILIRSDPSSNAESAATSSLDRSKIAKIVFGDPKERQRLEALIHPLVRASRATMIEEGQRQGAKAVIVDAPLLFEAGLDRECDAVVFVVSPRADRVARVRDGRGWGEEELDRREAAQWPLERKQAASSHSVINSGDVEGIRLQVRDILADVLENKRQRCTSDGPILRGPAAST